MFPAYLSEIQDLSSLMAFNNYSQVSDGVENLFQTFRIFTNGIPDDPRDWSSEHVCQWLNWVYSTFNLTDLQLDGFLDPCGRVIDGKALCKITKKQLCVNTSVVSGEILWESLQRICAEYNGLQKLRLDQLAMQKLMEKPSMQEDHDYELLESPEQFLSNTLSSMIPVQTPTSSESSHCESSNSLGSPLSENSPVGSPQQGSNIEPPPTPKVGRKKRGPKPVVPYTGNGPIQLYQFLLELLLSDAHKCDVEWTLEEKYEFKLKEPEKVAKMWGKRKNKPKMNYEKLSRGLRYYYGKDIITKVHGKRYVYRFLCDIEKILGYNPTGMNADFPTSEKTETETIPASPAASIDSENSLSSDNNGYVSSSCDSIFGDDFEIAFDYFLDDLNAVVPDGDFSAFMP